jgi:hypothetical protein
MCVDSAAVMATVFSEPARSWASAASDDRGAWRCEGANAFVFSVVKPLPMSQAQTARASRTGEEASTLVLATYHLDTADLAFSTKSNPAIRDWIKEDLLPDAVKRWETACTIKSRSGAVLSVLKNHKEAGTYPSQILEAVRDYKLPVESSKEAGQALVDGQVKVDRAVTACRNIMLLEGLAARQEEVTSAEKVLSEAFLADILPAEWAAKGTVLADKSFGIKFDHDVEPLIRAAIKDLQIHFAALNFKRQRELQAIEEKRRARDAAAADAKMDIDTDSISATTLEAIKEQVRKELKLAAAVEAKAAAPAKPKPKVRLGNSLAPPRSLSSSRSPSSSAHSFIGVADAVSLAEERQGSQQAKAQSDRPFQRRVRARKVLARYDEQERQAATQVKRQEARLQGGRRSRSSREQEVEGRLSELGGGEGRDGLLQSGLVTRAIAVSANSIGENNPPVSKALDVVVGPRFSVARASTFPPAFLSLSREERAIFVFMHSTLLWLDTRMAKPQLINPHGIAIPIEYQKLLTMNVKFIPRPRIDIDQPLQDWDKLERSVRIRYAFRDAEDKGFNPKFHIPSESEWKPPKASNSIEYGLSVGRKALTDALWSVDESVWRPNFSTRIVSAFKDFVRGADVLVKPADKNLGLVVLSRSWYIAEGLRQLQDDTTYAIEPEFGFVVEDLFAKRKELLARWSGKGLPGKQLTKQLLRYLSYPTEETLVIPEFHHLPKVHKPRLAGRPIVPSFAWITSNVSAFLDTLLQPIVKSFDWILRDSKDLLRKLEDVRFDSSKPVWIVTADIQSMYTNLPIEEGVQIMHWLGKRHYKDDAMGRFIGELTVFVLENSYLSFQGQTYHQIRGTAMGTAVAPAYANLFVAAYEENLSIPTSENLLFYGRFIDDVLAIVQGTREDAERFTSRLNDILPGILIFDAEYSQTSLPFLDATIVVEPSSNGLANGRLYTKVYQKPLNSYQYIPWSSYHPESVKLAFVKGELIRYVRLSSRYEDYRRIILLFWRRLRARGYPVRWLRKAFSAVSYKDFRARSLIDRIKDPTVRAPLVYHQTYNPVWNQVNGSKVLTHTVKHWKPAIRTVLTSSKRRNIIRCAHRGQSLGDIVNTLNKDTLLRDL